MLYDKQTIFKYRDKAQKASQLPVENLVEAGNQRRGLAVRDAEVSGQELQQTRDRVKQTSQQAQANPVDDWFSSIYEQRKQQNRSFEEEMGFAQELGTGRRGERRREEGGGPTSSSTPRRGPMPDTKLTEDQEFMSELNRVSDKYGRPVEEFMRVIKGESSFNPVAQHPKSKATGLFQFIPSTAEMLGTDVNSIKQMSPAEQVRLYDKYLDRFGYKGDNALGIMQGAPAYANRSANTVVYRTGTKAWEQNPGWRDGSGGPITVASMNRYYERQS